MPTPPSYIKAMCKAKVTNQPPLEWLFALSAKQGLISKSDDEYSLEINAQDLVRVVAFTDRPERIVRVITPSELANEWSMSGTNNFDIDPPNASFASSETPLDIIEITGSTSGGGKIVFKFKYLSVTQSQSGIVKDVILTIDSFK